MIFKPIRSLAAGFYASIYARGRKSRLSRCTEDTLVSGSVEVARVPHLQNVEPLSSFGDLVTVARAVVDSARRLFGLRIQCV